ncbi:hypothetical protein SSX86_026503 [Deinandra increscens subsp. villosa]|uniref:Protein BIC1-like n=1 Tax=Deinandra increscens subsp. villosa TaxID=3103831 RepID=A0AAP0CF22_9ASTR
MDATKNPNLETTHHHNNSLHNHTTSSQSFKRTHHEDSSFCMKKKKVETCCDEHEVAGELGDHHHHQKSEDIPETAAGGREKLKRHRMEMAGRVWIPDIWGQEDLLKKWIDCTVFDASVERSSVMSAREALIQEGGRSNLSIENSC